MALTIGTRLGPYEVTAPIGEGGMGQVYRARDTKLNRDVALKVLPDSFANDPDRLARFTREAQTLASLNHPNIAHIHGLEESGGVRALVMEFVEGEDLAHRIARGAISLEEALPIAKQVAEALEAAHEQGIVHRDLKPANIKLRPDGTVKVLDFGLAKATEPVGTAANVSQSPTITTPAMTAAGVILGTAAYMSPEQARGKPVDKRADIWAFGCVLFETLTGRRAFAGETSLDVIAAIFEREPDWTRLPPSTPPSIRRLLRRCLEKDPKRRLRDIGDVRLELDDEGVTTPAIRPASPRAVAWKTAAAVGAATLVVSVAATAWWLRVRTPIAVRHPAQFTFAAPDGAQLDVGIPVPSPDGNRIAFAVRSASGHGSLWIRALDSTAARPVVGTDDVAGPPFWSPDGRWLGFFAGGRLKKVDPSGGPVINICTIQNNLGATWNRDNVIVVAPVNRTVLYRVSAAGGVVEPITTLNAERKENSHRWPHFLPDGRHFLFTARSDVKENNMIYVGSLDSRQVTPLLSAQSGAVYAAGYILYAQEGTVMARAFDPSTLSVSGEAVPVAANVNHNTPSSEASFSASGDGSALAYLANVTRSANLTWFDRTGKPIGTVGPEKEYSEVRLSPDGKSAAVVIPDSDSGNRDIWLLDLAVGTLSRFTSHPANDWQMAWSSDGRRIAFASDRNGRSSVYVKPIDGGDEELLLEMPNRGTFPKDFSKDGRFLMLAIDSPGGVSSLWAMPLVGDRTPFSLSSVTVRENEATLARDGRWFAFDSQASGADEVYVAPFPKGARRRVSNGGGTQPRWRADGRELYYMAANNDIMAVAVSGTEPIELAAPIRLLSACGGSAARRPAPVGARGWYDATADGTRFLMACSGSTTNPSAITVSVDWAASVK